MNLGDLIQDIAQRFDAARLSYGHGTDNSWDEAVYLVLTVTGFADISKSWRREVDAQAQQRCAAFAQRRISERLPLGVFAWALSVHGL